MLYAILLIVHSYFRWLVLASLVYTIFRSYRGWLKKLPFFKFDNTIRHTTATIAHIQLTLGLCLYFVSPVVTYFRQNFKEAVHEREIRFFGMEHSLIMLIAVIVITIGSSLARKAPDDTRKFRLMAIWFTIGLILILSSIPWPFSPLVSRPYFRLF